MGEIKQTNFRIDSEKADAFRAFCEENGLNQAQGFDHLMGVLETARAKELVPERLVEIEEFEQHTKAILSGYLRSLETAKNTELRVRENFANDLIKKDKRIAELEEKVDIKTLAVEEAKAKAKEAIALQKQAENEALQAKKLQEKAEKTAGDKESMYEMSQIQLKEATDKLAGYPALKERAELLDKDLADALRIIKENQKDAEVDKERAVTAVRMEMDKALAEKDQVIAANELKAERALASLEKEKNAENQKLRDKIDSLKDERADLKEENTKLQIEIEKLRSQLKAFEK